MKHNYTLVEGDEKSLYFIKEAKTGHVIRAFRSFSDARKFMNHLNKGIGFDGWTPNFFLKGSNKS
jgi:hypothetical protein